MASSAQLSEYDLVQRYFIRAPQPAQLAQARVAIWGWGRHGGGQAAAEFCDQHGARITIIDALPAAELGIESHVLSARGWEWVPETALPAVFAQCDLVVVNPAISPHRLRSLRQQPPPMVCPEGLFMSAHRGRRVLVSGTKGKTTCAALLGHLLRWPVAGNSWQPLLRQVTADPLICELSSFQLRYLQVQAPTCELALLTNLGIDHLDWHDDVASYHQAKQQLTTWAQSVVGQGAADANQGVPPIRLAHGHFIDAHQRQLAPLSDLHLLGAHNQANACLALQAARALGLSAATLRDRLPHFQALPHRLQLVHRSHNLQFINDSIATNPMATMAALQALSGPLALILGGAGKQADFTPLLPVLRQRAQSLHLIGSEGRRLAALLAEDWGQLPVHQDLLAAMRAGVAALRQCGSGPGTLLLSPACASFGMFQDFAHRGQCFSELARRHWPTATAEHPF